MTTESASASASLNNSGSNNSGSGSDPAKPAVAAASDLLEERMIDSEYKIWKKNTPYLYDFVMTHSLEWPSLTCQWLPHVKRYGSAGAGTATTSTGTTAIASTGTTTSATGGATTTTTNGTSNNNNGNGNGASAAAKKSNTSSVALLEHQLLLGTHTTGEEFNHLMMATCILQSEQEEVVPSTDLGATKAATVSAANIRYDEEQKEVGGYGLAGPDVGKIEVKMKIKHEGEVNRARYMPQNHFILATRGPSAELYIWDTSKHPSIPDDKVAFCPQGVCMGHEKEGYAMAWSPHTTGHLLSGSEDTTVKLWDVTSAVEAKGPGTLVAASAGTQIMATHTFLAHTATVEDVAWHAKDPHMVGSVGDDKRLCLWDVRDPVSAIANIENAHESDINCLAFNPHDENLLATGCADSSIHIWDTRNLSKPMAKLLSHTDQVFKVEWSPFNHTILGSCAADRRVALWDLSRIGQEQSVEDAQDGPPELLFLHGGHTSKVSDFSWNTKNEWTIASVSEDNVLQVWKPAEEIYRGDDDDDDDENANDDENAALEDDELE